MASDGKPVSILHGNKMCASRSCCIGVGRVITTRGWFGATAVVIVFLASVPRSASSVRKLWTGNPSGVMVVLRLWIAAGERSALASGLLAYFPPEPVQHTGIVAYHARQP